jgi:signal transduction histidine kinase
VRIGTRITLITSVLVALTVGVYGYISLRQRRGDLETQLAREARTVAVALRVALETVRPRDFPSDAAALTAGLGLGLGWRIAVLDTRGLPEPEAPPTGIPRTERLRRLVSLRAPIVEEEVENGQRLLVHLEPVRAPAALAPDGMRVAAGIEVLRDVSSADAIMADELLRVVTWVLISMGVLVVAMSLTTRRGITRPIGKLIAGIDDVAKGDLSHVLLAEREDEVGALAARFNDMTKSLRDARDETRRGVEERLLLEQRLRATAELATIGQLAAEIAHEVGTPLNVVTGRARAMSKKSDDPEAVEKNASIIAEQAGRITRIIQRLLDVARRKVGDAERGEVDLNALVDGTLELLEYQLGSARIDPRQRLDARLPRLPGDRDQLQQVLLNLYMNAIQAMPEGGVLEVRTREVRRRRPGLEMEPEQRYAVLEVADSGAGVPAEERGKIFEPFYTSKEGGTGLGLAVAHGIVKDHDGWMEIGDNQAGRGAVFRVFLPGGVQ